MKGGENMIVPNQIITYKNGKKVRAEDLPKTSSMFIKVKCECCGCIKEVMYKTYTRSLKRNGKYCCADCWRENSELVKIARERQENTCLERYGSKTNLQTEDFKIKREATCMEKYGTKFPSQAQEVKDRVANTCIEKYGHSCSLGNPEVLLKAKQTNLDKYGVEYALQSNEVYNKTRDTLLENATGKGSDEERKIYDVILSKYPEAIHSKREGKYILDIYLELNGQKIDIECDGWYWHPLTSQSDKIRDEVHIQKGYKILRIRYDDQIPTPNEIFSAIEELITTNKQFKRIDISNK